ncbi:hypothetical protein ACOMD4_37265 [Streptomyces anulatus]|uniref:hypothetical protein n=1 Tax=Streptomyces anulatus TaxID=1892 RepID=UPI003B7E18A1
MPDGTQRWTLTEVTAYLGAASNDSTRRTLSRWGVQATGRRPGRGGESEYDAAEVRSAKASRPGRGARTDLHATDTASRKRKPSDQRRQREATGDEVEPTS